MALLIIIGIDINISHELEFQWLSIPANCNFMQVSSRVMILQVLKL